MVPKLDHNGEGEMKVELIYIGDNFYRESRSTMSSIYEVTGDPFKRKWKRWDWGFVSVALRNGDEIKIRPANPYELGVADSMLLDLMRRREARNGESI